MGREKKRRNPKVRDGSQRTNFIPLLVPNTHTQNAKIGSTYAVKKTGEKGISKSYFYYFINKEIR